MTIEQNEHRVVSVSLITKQNQYEKTKDALQAASTALLALKNRFDVIPDDIYYAEFDTPIVLMGYFNPISSMGKERFLEQCIETGVDGLIVVDLPPEEDSELCIPALEKGINFIRLATPTSDNKRMKSILKNTSGFLYYVSITGITGAAKADKNSVAIEVARIKELTDLPVCVGFGVKTPDVAKEIASVADGVVVGTAIVDKIASGSSTSEIAKFCKDLAEAAHST